MNANFLFSLLLVLVLSLVGGQPSTTGCTRINVCYALDESGSISSADFDLLSDAVIDITAGVLGRAPGSTFSAVGFSSTPTLIQALTANVTGVFNPAIMNNIQSGGGTSIGPALTLCNDILTAGMGSDPNVIVLLTDGADDGSGAAIAPNITANGTTIAAVAVDGGVSSMSLMTIASDPSLFIPVTNFSALADSILDIVDMLCAIEPIPACASVECIRCGRVLECYVDTGSMLLDEQTCGIVMTRFRFCPIRQGQQTICGQPCTIRDGIQCFPGQGIPTMCPARVRNGSPVRCQGGGRLGQRAVASSFATYRICNGTRFTCRGRCDRGFSTTCRP